MQEKYLVVVADLDCREITVVGVYDNYKEARAYADGYNSAADQDDIGSFADVIKNM